jgi:tetratricopeptide (TPR) repeat protein
MLKAWRAYVTTLSQRRQGDVVKEPDWYEAIVKSNSQSKFADPTDQALNDPAIPKTYGLLSAAAGVFTRDDPARAIDLLQQAEPFLPRSNHNEVARYYNRLVDLLSQNKEFSQAIDAQRKYTEQTGHGQAHLALLYYQHDYDEAGDSVLQSLMTDSASEHEINVLAKALQILASDTQYPHSEKMVERTISLLQNYLNMQRERTVEEELKARKTLGTLLIHQNRYHEASKVLDISHLKQPFLTLSAKSDAASIQRLLSASSIKIE